MISSSKTYISFTNSFENILYFLQKTRNIVQFASKRNTVGQPVTYMKLNKLLPNLDSLSYITKSFKRGSSVFSFRWVFNKLCTTFVSIQPVNIQDHAIIWVARRQQCRTIPTCCFSGYFYCINTVLKLRNFNFLIDRVKLISELNLEKRISQTLESLLNVN